MQNQKARELLIELFFTGIKAVDPYNSVISELEDIQKTVEKERFRDIFVFAFGKGACKMAKAAEEALEGYAYRGGIITKYGHCQGYNPERLKLYEAAHPVPDENSVRATEEVLSMLGPPEPQRLCLCLISGGGSALMVSPLQGLTLFDKQVTTEVLLKAGADIHALNTVRKHLSRVKGGRLAERFYPSRIVSLIISDVLGDRIDIIASGPTAPDPSTYADALSTLEGLSLVEKVPSVVIDTLKKGVAGEIPETPKPGDKVFRYVDNIIVANNRKALEAIKQEALRRGLAVEILTESLQSEAREAAHWLVQQALKYRRQQPSVPLLLISGGETTVTVKGKGKGGRNMELALAFAIEIAPQKGITLLSAGSDGTDGPTDAAGAIVDSSTVARAKTMGLEPETFLDENDSYNFFKKTGEIFITGPTGTNVMDIQLILLE